MTRLVVFDMDGVLADAESSWVYVHRRFGVNNDHSLHAYLRGEIDDLEFISRDVKLWMQREPGVTEGRIASILDDVPMMRGAAATVSELKGAGIMTAIVSAGIDLLAKRIARNLDIDFCLANGFAKHGDGRLSGQGILRVRLMDKGDAVSEAADALGAAKGEVVAVGNSRYDISMFRRSGKGIAFCPADEEVRKYADAVVEERDLVRILDHI